MNTAASALGGNCVYTEKQGVGIISFPTITDAGCCHGFTARGGGVSLSPLNSLNLGLNRPEPRENIIENYSRLCGAFSLDFNSLILASYVHGTNVLPVTREHCGAGITRPRLPDCDGLITNDPAVTLVTLHADCAAYFVYDPVTRSAGLAHAGWRGALGRIGRGLVTGMRDNYGSRPSDLIVGIGPSICGECFEVGEDVARRFEDEFRGGVTYSGDKGHVSLLFASKRQFLDCGVLEENIHASDLCTYCEEALFFSYRRDAAAHGITGAMAAFMRLPERTFAED